MKIYGAELKGLGFKDLGVQSLGFEGVGLKCFLALGLKVRVCRPRFEDSKV